MKLFVLLLLVLGAAYRMVLNIVQYRSEGKQLCRGRTNLSLGRTHEQGGVDEHGNGHGPTCQPFPR